MIGTAGVIAVFGGPFSYSGMCISACVAVSAFAFVLSTAHVHGSLAHPKAHRFLSQCFGGRLATRDQSRFALRVPAARGRGLQSALEAPPEIVIGRPLVDARVPVQSLGWRYQEKGSSRRLWSSLLALFVLLPSTVEAAPRLRSTLAILPYGAVVLVVWVACRIVGGTAYRDGVKEGKRVGYDEGLRDGYAGRAMLVADNTNLKTEVQRLRAENVGLLTRCARQEQLDTYRAKAESIRRMP